MTRAPLSRIPSSRNLSDRSNLREGCGLFARKFLEWGQDKKYIGKKGINYRDFVFQLNPLVSESFVLEGFVDGYDDKILTLACVVAGTNLHFYRPHDPWGYHTRAMLEGLDKYFNQHFALDRYKNSDILRRLTESIKKSQLTLAVVSLIFFAGAITMIVLGIVNVIPLWLGLLIGIPFTLGGGFMGIGNLIAYFADVVGKHFKNNELYDNEFYHLATYSRLR